MTVYLNAFFFLLRSERKIVKRTLTRYSYLKIIQDFQEKRRKSFNSTSLTSDIDARCQYVHLETEFKLPHTSNEYEVECRLFLLLFWKDELQVLEGLGEPKEQLLKEKEGQVVRL